MEVRETSCVMSTGEILLVKWAKLRALCEQVCQEGCPIWIRTWTTPDGEELIELHRCGETVTDDSTVNSAVSEDVF